MAGAGFPISGDPVAAIALAAVPQPAERGGVRLNGQDEYRNERPSAGEIGVPEAVDHAATGSGADAVGVGICGHLFAVEHGGTVALR